MALSKLEKPKWHAYFDNMSKILQGKRVEIEVDALAIGSQVEAEWLPLMYITYDPKDDIIECCTRRTGSLHPQAARGVRESDRSGPQQLGGNR
jgi:hypothetical protein